MASRQRLLKRLGVFESLSSLNDRALNPLRSSRVAGRPLFISGNGRSGTSWIGGTLGRAAGTLYYREPCHPVRNGLDGLEVERVWSRYVPREGTDPYFEQTLGSAFRGRSWRGCNLKTPASTWLRSKQVRVIVKDVASFASTQWVAETWRPDVLVIWRHPAAYAASVARLAQDERNVKRLRILLATESVRAKLSAELCARLDAVEDVLQVAVAGWALRTKIVHDAWREHPEWAAIHYEDVAQEPVASFASLYKRFGLTWTDADADWVQRTTTEAQGGSFATSRVSARHAHAWREQLDRHEIKRLRRLLEDFDLPLYATADDWP